jgi:hypothetical protein
MNGEELRVNSALNVHGGGNVLTNGGGEYTITVPLGTASNSPVNRKQLYDLLDERSIVTLYGSTSVHSTLAGAYGLESIAPTTAWAVTNASLGDGTNWVGYFFTTNTTTILRAGTYIGRFYAQKTAGTKTANAVIQLVYSDTATTNVVATSAGSGAIASSLDSYRVHASADTNVMGTALYVGVRYGIAVSGAGTDPTVVTYGGGDYNTHLETPGFGPVSGYVLDGQTGVTLSGTLTPTNALTVTNALQLDGIAAANYATNAGAAGTGYYAQSNGAWVAFSPGTGGGGGADLNSTNYFRNGQNLTNLTSVFTGTGLAATSTIAATSTLYPINVTTITTADSDWVVSNNTAYCSTPGTFLGTVDIYHSGATLSASEELYVQYESDNFATTNRVRLYYGSIVAIKDGANDLGLVHAFGPFTITTNVGFRANVLSYSGSGTKVWIARLKIMRLNR